MKKVTIIFALLLVLGIVFASGCTTTQMNNTTKNASNSTPAVTAKVPSDTVTAAYYIKINNATDLATFTKDKAIDAVSPKSDDASMGITVTDHGTKTIEGITVYYSVYTDSSDNSVNGDIYFEKNGKWHLLTWKDKTGNPNKTTIDNDVADKVKNI